MLQRSTSLLSQGSETPGVLISNMIELCRSSSYSQSPASKTTCCSAALPYVATGRSTRGLMNADMIELRRSSSYLLPLAGKITCCSAALLYVATGPPTRGLLIADMIELCRSSSYLQPPASKITCCSAALLYVATGPPTRGLLNADMFELCRSSSYELRLPPSYYIFPSPHYVAVLSSRTVPLISAPGRLTFVRYAVSHHPHIIAAHKAAYPRRSPLGIRLRKIPRP